MGGGFSAQSSKSYDDPTWLTSKLENLLHKAEEDTKLMRLCKDEGSTEPTPVRFSAPYMNGSSNQANSIINREALSSQQALTFEDYFIPNANEVPKHNRLIL